MADPTTTLCGGCNAWSEFTFRRGRLVRAVLRHRRRSTCEGRIDPIDIARYQEGGSATQPVVSDRTEG